MQAIRAICVEQAEELGKMELGETKIGRLDHKIAKLRDAIPRAPGVEITLVPSEHSLAGAQAKVQAIA